jgi:hypothetical protein
VVDVVGQKFVAFLHIFLAYRGRRTSHSDEPVFAVKTTKTKVLRGGRTVTVTKTTTKKTTKMQHTRPALARKDSQRHCMAANSLSRDLIMCNNNLATEEERSREPYMC